MTPNDKQMDGKEREDKIAELYRLMEHLSEEHGAEFGRLERVDDETISIVLEYELPARDTE